MAKFRRLRQGLAGLRPRLPEDRERLLALALPDSAAAHFRTLPPFEQMHGCAVARWLVLADVTDTDLLAAALMHDIGKQTPVGGVRLIDRVVRVLIKPLPFGLWNALSRPPATGWRRGLVLSAHHPRIGAEQAAQLGCSERTCWLIAHHEDEPRPNDPDLRLLSTADRESAALMYTSLP